MYLLHASMKDAFTINWTGFSMLVRSEIERFLRIATQTLIAPWITALLYVFIFGSVVGSRIDEIGGVRYVDFALPGILMLSLVTTAFAQSSTSLYFRRFAKHIEELLVAPIANGTLVAAFLLGSIIRGVIVAVGVLGVAVLFGAANFAHLPLFFFYIIGVSSIFGLLGIVVGLWAKGFEQLNVLTVFAITPLLFLGGVFYSITMLPGIMQTAILFNPLFYFVDGIRYAMIGVAEGSLLVGSLLVIVLNIALFWWVWYLFKVGYGIRS
jgi:ABC-2 type transport system permease protein